jgi:small redox-active disulfide protein 2
MDIKVLGIGCSRCKELEKRTMNALTDLGVAADVQNVSDIQDIMKFKITATPGLAIDGKVRSAGRLPTLDEIKGWIREASDRG